MTRLIMHHEWRVLSISQLRTIDKLCTESRVPSPGPESRIDWRVTAGSTDFPSRVTIATPPGSQIVFVMLHAIPRPIPSPRRLLIHSSITLPDSVHLETSSFQVQGHWQVPMPQTLVMEHERYHGPLSMLTVVVLQMASKHQTAPTAMKTPAKFHETRRDWLRNVLGYSYPHLFPVGFLTIDMSA
jgi:hypothetical protein